MNRDFSTKDGIVLIFRELSPEMVWGAQELCRAAGWNQTDRDWRRLIQFHPEGCFAAFHGDAIAATVTTTVYEDRLGWIGMVLVRPEYRRQGIGRWMLDCGLEYLRSIQIPLIKLDATPMGRPLYESMGFVAGGGILRMRGPALSVLDVLPEGIRLAVPEDIRMMTMLDRRAFGMDRQEVLAALTEDFPGFAYVSMKKGVLAGFALGREGTSADQAGPVCSLPDAPLEDLLRAVLSAPGKDIRILDVPEVRTDVVKFLEGVGYEVERSFTRMQLGGGDCRGETRLYAVTHCPELG